MIPAKPPAGDFHFRMIGGGLQLRISDEAGLANVLKLDEALWAMTGVDIDSLRFDRRFLEFVDSDHDGKIRTDEIKEAVEFTLKYFCDLDGVVSGSGQLRISAISPAAPGAAEIISCAKVLLKDLGRNENDVLTAADIRESKSFTGFTLRNGDGIISCAGELPEEVTALIKAVIASGRKSTDLNGNDGVSMADVTAFEAALANRLALDEAVRNDPAIMVYGEKTGEIHALFKECEPLIDGYFLNSAAGAFLFDDPERAVKKEFAADLMVPENVRKALASAALAAPGDQDALDFSVPLNPLYRDKLQQLIVSPALRDLLDGTILTRSAFLRAKAMLAPFDSYQEKVSAPDGLANFSIAELRRFAPENFAELKRLIEADLSFAPVISAGETLIKMALYQQFLVELLNNFVALPDLFNPAHPSRLQMGKLIMDGRHFTLAVRVKNPAEHKRIIKSSNICVIYVEISRKNGKENLTGQLAVAVTSGTMRSLFIGKRGVFFDTENRIFDAVITDIAEQPVSIGEAFKAPFYNFADFLAKQTERIFNTRNAEMQKSITGELNKSQLANAPKLPAAAGKAAPAVPPPPPQSTGSNLSMLLMGGGIGIAALGSSVAFIAKSLQNVSFGTILAVLAGVVVIFGGPSVVIALIRIFRRNLSRFLESCGCAVNRPMRMNCRMGAIFTFAPKRPAGKISMLDPVDLFNPVKKFTARRIIWTLIVLIAGAVCGVVLSCWHMNYAQKQLDSEKNRVQTIKNNQSVPQAKSPAAKNQKEN